MSKICNTLIAGIVIGILIAPDKGSNTRRKISRRAQAIRDKFSGAAEDGSPMAPMGRDSGLSTQISPEIMDIV